MLRLYKPLVYHEIFKLHEMLEYLVCSVWCEAGTATCSSMLKSDFKVAYDEYEWLKTAVDDIYEDCKRLTSEERSSIKEAFNLTNQIEELCNGSVVAKQLKDLPEIVAKKMKPLLVRFYEELLDRSKIPGSKLDYYNELISINDDIHYCPCCGIMPFEAIEGKYREAFDHYLPKKKYPFLSVNFENLVPICHKCNSDRKGTKDPIEGGRKAFYPFANDLTHNIDISFEIDKTKDIGNLQNNDLKVDITGTDHQKIKTWDSLFDIEERYGIQARSFSKTFLNKIIRRHNEYLKANPTQTYSETLELLIKDYEFDKYEDVKFLKIPFLKELKNCKHLIDAYNSTP